MSDIKYEWRYIIMCLDLDFFVIISCTHSICAMGEDLISHGFNGFKLNATYAII